MTALLKIEAIQVLRNWTIFILSIGMTVGFFLLYSGMQMADNTNQQALFIQRYLLTMTSFSMSSFALFTFPFMLQSDKISHYLTYIEHSPVPIWKYYLAKIIRVLIYFIIAISVTFTVGILFRGVSMSLDRWFMSILLLLMTSLVFLAMGLLLAQIPSSQILSIAANILFFALAILGGSWIPISVFPDWMQVISKITPTYHANQVVTTFAEKGELLGKSLLIVFAYAIIIGVVALVVKEKSEVK
ncbi:ABC transporter permease [Streptococcus sp. X16XC17]|uniref:ABC transporter permease n=1 Tax=unclassified Streptococcus TaxID=2608887 RepID=UPI00066FBA46|nr:MULTISPECIES: ABC transporter permease [unclassified Streptococcus]TCD46737.1 ABC transporter permease [Streptococcus sp. X16XC17]